MRLIQLYGGPGTGKSTIAAGVFYKLKDMGINAELIQEYVKSWAWEQRKPISFDQFYIFGQQARREYPLISKVDIAVSDSPITLCGYYAKAFGSKEQSQLFNQMVLEYMRHRAAEGVIDTHIFLRRIKPYNPKGRFQNEAEARAIDEDMKLYLSDLGIQYTEIDAELELVMDFLKTFL